MKLGIIVTLIILGLGGLFFVSQDRPSSMSPTAQLTFQNVQSDITNGAGLIDVRTAEEYKAGHIAGSVNLSLQEIQAGKMPDTMKDKTIYVYCHSGNRSGQAAVILKNAGYTVVDLGAITHVQSIGGAITT